MGGLRPWGCEASRTQRASCWLSMANRERVWMNCSCLHKCGSTSLIYNGSRMWRMDSHLAWQTIGSEHEQVVTFQKFHIVKQMLADGGGAGLRRGLCSMFALILTVSLVLLDGPHAKEWWADTCYLARVSRCWVIFPTYRLPHWREKRQIDLISRGRENTGDYFPSLHIEWGSAEVNMAREIIKPVFSRLREIRVLSQEG